MLDWERQQEWKIRVAKKLWSIMLIYKAGTGWHVQGETDSRTDPRSFIPILIQTDH